jgi:hypothetical protein
MTRHERCSIQPASVAPLPRPMPGPTGGQP